MEPRERKEICSISNGERCLKTYLIPSTGSIGFEVKNNDDLIYMGESFQQATTVYEGLCRHPDRG